MLSVRFYLVRMFGLEPRKQHLYFLSQQSSPELVIQGSLKVMNTAGLLCTLYYVYYKLMEQHILECRNYVYVYMQNNRIILGWQKQPFERKPK